MRSDRTQAKRSLVGAGVLLLSAALGACGSAPNPALNPPSVPMPVATTPAATMPMQAAATTAGSGVAVAPDAGLGAGQPAVASGGAGADAKQAGTGAGGSAGAANAAGASGKPAAADANSGGAGGAIAGAAAGGAGGNSLPSAGSGGSAGATAPTTAATAADFAKAGPYKAMRLKNQGKGTVSGGTMGTIGEGGDDPSGFTVFLPQGVKNGERFPLLTWGNGTFCSPTLYDELMNFVVSYGYVVVASNTSNAGTGAEMLKAVEWALAENDKADSPLHGLIDREKIGAFGHSQGGEGAVNTGSDARIRAIAPLSAGPMGSGEAKIQCPAFYTLTANDVVPPESYRASYDATKAPSAYGVTKGGDHMEYTDKANGLGLPGLTSNDAVMTRSAITAWFEFQLKARKELQPLFVGKDCGFCKDTNWKSFESKGF